MRISSITNNHLYSCYLWCGSCIQNLCLFLYGIHMHELSLFIGNYPDLQFHLTFGCLGECMTICLRHSSITSHSWFLLCLTDLDIKSYHPHRGLRVCRPPSPFYDGLETQILIHHHILLGTQHKMWKSFGAKSEHCRQLLAALGDAICKGMSVAVLC